jgi:hypothetical protein
MIYFVCVSLVKIQRSLVFIFLLLGTACMAASVFGQSGNSINVATTRLPNLDLISSIDRVAECDFCVPPGPGPIPLDCSDFSFDFSDVSVLTGFPKTCTLNCFGALAVFPGLFPSDWVFISTPTNFFRPATGETACSGVWLTAHTEGHPQGQHIFVDQVFGDGVGVAGAKHFQNLGYTSHKVEEHISLLADDHVYTLEGMITFRAGLAYIGDDPFMVGAELMKAEVGDSHLRLIYLGNYVVRVIGELRDDVEENCQTPVLPLKDLEFPDLG